jgi:hypothetical protein
MTTLYVFTATCCCGTRFQTWAPSMFTIMGQESDLRTDYGFEDPSPYALHTCPTCSFTGDEEMFMGLEHTGILKPGCSPVPPPETHEHVALGERFRWPIVDLVQPAYRETALRWVLHADACSGQSPHGPFGPAGPRGRRCPR